MQSPSIVQPVEVPDLFGTKPKFSTQRISPAAVFTQKHEPSVPQEPQLSVTPVGEQTGGAVVGGAVVVEKHVRVTFSRHWSVPPHPRQQSQGWPACVANCAGVTQSVSAAPRRQVPSERWGMWQILTVPCGQVIAAIAREGISAAMAVPAKSFSARRRLIEPSARERASSSKPWPLVGSSLVGSSDTWCLLSS